VRIAVIASLAMPVTAGPSVDHAVGPGGEVAGNGSAIAEAPDVEALGTGRIGDRDDVGEYFVERVCVNAHGLAAVAGAAPVEGDDGELLSQPIAIAAFLPRATGFAGALDEDERRSAAARFPRDRRLIG
jgi:hypothetical protein